MSPKRLLPLRETVVVSLHSRGKHLLPWMVTVMVYNFAVQKHLPTYTQIEVKCGGGWLRE